MEFLIRREKEQQGGREEGWRGMSTTKTPSRVLSEMRQVSIAIYGVWHLGYSDSNSIIKGELKEFLDLLTFL